jgi:hypothetical protein
MSASTFLRTIGIGAAMLLGLRAGPAAAQSASARVTASVTVVERVGIAPGATTIAAGRNGHLDVTTPLAIQGRAATVLHVIEGNPSEASHPPLSAVVRRADRASGEHADAFTARHRISPAPPSIPGDTRAAVTYVVSTVN